MLKHFLLPFVALSFLTACSYKKDLVQPDDYNAFLKNGPIQKKVQQTRQELGFWQQRLQRDSGNFVDMLEIASAHLRLFRLTGEINDLKTGDSLLKRSAAKLKNSDPEILFALSQTAVTQHQFRDAAIYSEAAQKANGDLYTARLLGFDAGMELGQYNDALLKLETLKEKSSFDYLIRKAKAEDQKGNLTRAIELMELAFEKVKDKKKDLYCWALSNLGDMYGHAGRTRESYDAYIKVLQKDSSYIYALKGIAWIAYSHDQNTREAKRILHYILSQAKMPELYLTLAEIEEWEGNMQKKKEYIDRFIAEVVRPEYGDMYNKYLIGIYTTRAGEVEKALILAQKEVANRATPETMDWLAWVHFKRGETDLAFNIALNSVYKKNFEPDAVFHTALIFAAKGKRKEAKKMLEQCLESSYEMGPLATKEIKEKLAAL